MKELRANLFWGTLLYSVTLNLHAEIVVGSILHVPNDRHVLVEKEDGEKIWMGHNKVLDASTLGKKFRFDCVPRKVGNYARLSTSSESSVKTGKGLKLVQVMKGGHGYFKDKDGHMIGIDFEKGIPLEASQLGTIYDIEYMSSYRGLLAFPAEKDREAPAGFARVTLLSVRPDDQHKLFILETSDGEKIQAKMNDMETTSAMMGKHLDVQIYEKYFANHVEYEDTPRQYPSGKNSPAFSREISPQG